MFNIKSFFKISAKVIKNPYWKRNAKFAIKNTYLMDYFNLTFHIVNNILDITLYKTKNSDKFVRSKVAIKLLKTNVISKHISENTTQTKKILVIRQYAFKIWLINKNQNYYKIEKYNNKFELLIKKYYRFKLYYFL